jgi:hypothetical protein
MQLWKWPIPVAAWCKAGSAAFRLLGLRVRTPLGTWMSLVRVVRCQSSLRQADPSSRGVQPCVCVCVCVCVYVCVTECDQVQQ